LKADKQLPRGAPPGDIRFLSVDRQVEFFSASACFVVAVKALSPFS
jgi:hypothetical protein